ncbi:short chain dehydrogenase [Seiridium cupressi]
MQKVVLITGCTDGSAGAALARQFQLRSCRVFATARQLEKMKALADLGIDTLVMDVSSQPQIDTAVETVREAAGGRLDILINNAAAFNLMPMADQNIDDARAMFDVNVFGLLAVTQSFRKQLPE